MPLHRQLVVLGCLFAAAAGGATAPPAAPDPSALLAKVRALAAPALEGRGNGTPAALTAADSVAGWFARAGLAPAGDAGRWFQDFSLRGGDKEGRPARNVVGKVAGAGRLAGRWLVLGAHYDHLGLVAGGAAGGCHPGADDNASGVAAICEIARLLAAGPTPESARGVLVVAFAGEEDGLQGSTWFVGHLPVARDSLDFMLNLDGVGRLREERLYVAGTGSADALPAIVEATNAARGLRIEASRGGWEASDHVAFLTAGVPALFLMTGPHEQYHTPADDWPLIDAGGLARVTDFAHGLVAAVRVQPESLPYTPVPEPPPARREPAAGGGRRAWFGVIPDFVEGTQGVRLAGVMPGSPAAAAGLAAGDVLVAFDGRAVANLQDYTEALRARAPGDSVKVELQRGPERIVRLVALAARR